MDAKHFDTLVKSLVIPESRRRLLTLLASLPVLGGLLGILSPEDAEAKDRRRRRKQRHQRRKDPGSRKGKGKKKKPCTPTCTNRCDGGSDGCGGTCTGSCGANQLCVSQTCRTCDVCTQGCAHTGVQAAIDAKPTQTTFIICPGEYVGNLTLNRELELVGAGDGEDIAANTTLRGLGSPDGVITITNNNQDVTLRGLRITGGAKFGGGRGGGVSHSGAALTMIDCTVTGNREVDAGGGLAASGGSPGSSLELINCTIVENEVAGSANPEGGVGGGIFTAVPTTLKDCRISGNFAQANGGGVFAVGADLVTIEGATVICSNAAPRNPNCAGFSDPACQDTCPA